MDVQTSLCLAGFDGLPHKSNLTQEEALRAFIVAALFSFAISSTALADESVSGNWHANLGGGVTINMNVNPDGGWSSVTRQKNQVVRQMKGTYKQMPSDNGKGTLIFTPTQSAVKNGIVQPETDQYETAEDGKQLKLTSDGDTMVFEKREPH